MHFNGQTFSNVFELFSFTSKFFGLKMQKSTFLKKKIFLRVVFIKSTFRWLQNWSVRLNKHLTVEILLVVDFFHIFKMLQFSKFFEIFQIHQYFLVKLVNALNFYLNTVGQTQ